MSMPLAVHHRLDVLTDLATDLNATRAEIIAMLIAHADLDVELLEKTVLAYRKMTVGDVVPTKPGEPSPEEARQRGEAPAAPTRSPASAVSRLAIEGHASKLPWRRQASRRPKVGVSHFPTSD